MPKEIPFLSFNAQHDPLKDQALKLFEEFYQERQYVAGRGVGQFEEAFAAYTNVKHCICVSNGLEALRLSLLALGIQAGEEVIVASNAYIACIHCIAQIGAKPVLVEPSPQTHNIDPLRIEEAVTPKTKAVLAVHLYGRPCPMQPLLTLCEKYGLYLVEDNAQAQGATYQGQKTGSFGRLNATSFYPSKNLGALGEAGAVTTNDDELAQKLQMLRNYGFSQKNIAPIVGYNARMDELQARLLLLKLPYLDRWNEERRKIASWYKQYLPESVTRPTAYTEGEAAYHLYVLRSPQRNKLKDYLQQQGVGTMVHYPIPPHLQEAYRYLGHKRGDFPIAERLAGEVLSLPMYVGLKEHQVKQIAEAVNDFGKARA